MKYTYCLLVAAAFFCQSHAQEFKPYPRSNITEAQWQAYFDEVRKKHGATAQNFDDQKLVAYTDQTTGTVYSFTKPGHPAHPAWISRRVEPRGDSKSLVHAGYFAGAEPPFAKLFREFLASDRERVKDAQRGSAGSAEPTTPIIGITGADARLKRDVEQMLRGAFEAQIGCTKLEAVEVERIRRAAPTDPPRERWTAVGCGKRVPAEVTFMPDGKGGTNINVKLDKQ